MTRPSQATLLIVDDQPENLQVLSDLLQPEYRVRAARNGEQALRAAANEPRPDLILLDVMMPEMDGYTILARLREAPATAAIPVIFVTALADTQSEEKGLKLGAVDYLSKPVSPTIVQARVRLHLELKAARDALADQNALLEAKVQARTAELEKALATQEQAHEQLRQNFLSMVQVFASLIELRGSRLAGHARRVAETTRRIGRRLGLEGRILQETVVAAILHDIGKMILPDHLLDCPLEQMTADERAAYMRHAHRGASALMAIESLAGSAEIIRHHHEHFDGSGYPNGVRGMMIPIGSRILAVANEFDGLCLGSHSGRALPRPAAVRRIAEGRGHRYDPAVVDAFLQEFGSEQDMTVIEREASTAELRPGHVLAQDLVSRDGIMLLAKTAVLTKPLIDQLKAYERAETTRLSLQIVTHQEGG